MLHHTPSTQSGPPFLRVIIMDNPTESQGSHDAQNYRVTLSQNFYRSTSLVNDGNVGHPQNRVWLYCLSAGSSIQEVNQRNRSGTKKKQTWKIGKLV